MRAGHQTITLEIEGKDLSGLDKEIGGHRIQRVPPTETRGRVHSSTITVSVLGNFDANQKYLMRTESDFSLSYYSGKVKAGGQNHNKTQNCIRITHIPTGIVKAAQSRSRENSYQNAFQALNLELDRLAALSKNNAENITRRGQIGSGERSDKRRTWRFQEGRVIDHELNRQAQIDQLLKGNFQALWE